VERDTHYTVLRTSLLLAVERDTSYTSILLAEDRDTQYTSILLAVNRDTHYTSILLVVVRDTPCTPVEGDKHYSTRPYCWWWKGILLVLVVVKGIPNARPKSSRKKCTLHFYRMLLMVLFLL
jgi:hypothetical protein